LSLHSNLDFLRSVLIHSLTAFGGPQGHYTLLLKNFVENRKEVSEQQLLDLNLFCQLIPGASSTQLLFLLGYRKGGLGLGFLTLLIWVFPATFLMGSAAIYFTLHPNASIYLDVFRYLQPMVVGYILFAAYRSYLLIQSSFLYYVILIISTIACLVFFKTPWTFPIVLILGALSALWQKEQERPKTKSSTLSIRWFPLTLFCCLFLVSGSLSEISKKEGWSHRYHFNLFENCYRFGSLVFGGGDVLIPLMYEQYVARPSSKRVLKKNQNVLKIDKSLFLTGAGLVRVIPGPVFSFSAFTGSAVMKNSGPMHQLLGIIIATIAIFLPSVLLVLFFYPLWEYIHRFDSYYSILHGIQAATIGIMLASSIYLSKDILFFISQDLSSFRVDMALVILSSFLLLQSDKFPPPFIAILFLLMGALV
jgi:chromate transporter